MEGVNGRYQLRHAAGLYWLLDMEQEGLEFQPPISFNESGAYIWRKLEAGMKPEKIAECLSREFEIEYCEARQDVDQFLEQLHEKRIKFGE